MEDRPITGADFTRASPLVPDLKIVRWRARYTAVASLRATR
jgi:hypothetical protein